MKESFTIAKLSRADIEQCGFKGVENIPDSVMERIAEKMGDIYVEYMFWESLDGWVEEYAKDYISR